MATTNHKQMSLSWAIAAAAIAALALAVILLWKPWANHPINNFKTCKDAGGAILESYPEQCMLNGKSFTNTPQIPKASDGNEYVGLTEQTALDKAKSANKPARVVERDGQALAMTMDYVPGRLNLYVKDGKIYKVQVEGTDNQSTQ